jgi:hypothetical protein
MKAEPRGKYGEANITSPENVHCMMTGPGGNSEEDITILHSPKDEGRMAKPILYP